MALQKFLLELKLKTSKAHLYAQKLKKLDKSIKSKMDRIMCTLEMIWSLNGLKCYLCEKPYFSENTTSN